MSDSDSDVFISEKVDRLGYAPAAGLGVTIEDNSISPKEMMFQIVELRAQTEQQAQLIESLQEQLQHQTRLVETYTKENMRLRKENEMKMEHVREARLKKLDSSSKSISSRLRAAKGSDDLSSGSSPRSLSERVASIRAKNLHLQESKSHAGQKRTIGGPAGNLT